MKIRHATLAGATISLVGLLPMRAAHAQVFERFSLHVEGGAGFFLAGEQTHRFGPGGDVIARLGFRIVGPLHVQLSATNAWFSASDPSAAVGRMYGFEGGLRFAPLIGRGAIGGPFVDANAGLAITGTLQRFTADAGLGWLFRPTSFFGIGPVVRYAFVYQPDDQAVGDDAHILFAGITLVLSPPPRAARSEASENVTRTPPRDDDRDGVTDDVDRCPSQPEDRDGFRDEDGCPDPDNDGDGIPDATDRCPDQAETRNGFEDDDGCADTPPAPPVPRTENEQRMEEIGNHVLFDNASHRLRSDTRAAITEMCSYLASHPEIVRVRVEGHADERGSADFNQELSAYRSAAVARALVQCSVAPERLESAGVGATHRLCEDGSETCHQRNRRVQFEIIERRRDAP